MANELPRNIEAERSLISAMLLGGAKEVVRKAITEDFYMDAHKAIYQAACELVSEGIPVDLVSLEAKVRGSVKASYLAELLNREPTAIDVDWMVGELREAFLRRQAIIDMNSALKAAYEAPDIGDVRNLARQAAKNLDSPISGGKRPVSAAELAKTMPEIWRKKQEDKRARGVTTGFKRIDETLGLLQSGDLVIVAARPGMGKTAFAANIAENAARKGHAVGFESLEMPNEQIWARMTAGNARVDAGDFRKCDFQPHQWRDIMEAQKGMEKLPMYFDDRPALHHQEIARTARNMQDEHGIKLLVVDYLQLAKADQNKGGRHDLEVGEISGAMKALAKELGITVVLLSQLNRKVEERNDKHPMLSDLRDSGSIEQDADIVLMLYRDEKYNPETRDKDIAEVDIAKNRFGETGVVKLRWIGFRQRFEDLW